MDSNSSNWPDTTETQLQSKEHRDLLDIIDKLRSQEISQYVDLPQIIVCGAPPVDGQGPSSPKLLLYTVAYSTKYNALIKATTGVRQNFMNHQIHQLYLSKIPPTSRSLKTSSYSLRRVPGSFSSNQNAMVLLALTSVLSRLDFKPTC